MPYIDNLPVDISKVPDHPQCNPTKLKIIHVGAGASGLLFAHKARKWLQNYELICYEKNDNIGGTWYENRYPGCACDVPAHTYTYPFEAYTEWSGFFSFSDEIQTYFENFARKYDVLKFVQLNTEVLSTTWNDDTGMWTVELKRGDETFTDTCHVIVNGSGVVNKWKWPAIEGLHDFKGALSHSAHWDESIDWKDKRVAVLGTGSSSIQMVPKFAETAKSVTVFMRNKTYIGVKFGINLSNKETDPDAMDADAAGKHLYTEKEKQRFRTDPAFHLKYRKQLEQTAAGHFRMFIRGSDLNQYIKKAMQDSMAEALKDNEDLRKRLIPEWSPGCRRLTPGPGYLETLCEPHVHTVHENIVKVTPSGLVTADGKEIEVDIIACATGFDVSFFPHFRIVGQKGKVMQDADVPNVYASVAAPGFPNYFVVNGPRGNWGQGCALPSHEVQIEYIMQCCKHMQEDHIKSMAPKESVTTQLNLYMDAWHKKNSVWAEDCRSWYKDNTRDGRIYIWPGSSLHHIKYMKRPRFEHFDITYNQPDNIFAFLGNGLTIGEEKYGAQVPVPYIRNYEEEAWEIE